MFDCNNEKETLVFMVEESYEVYQQDGANRKLK